MEKPHRLFCAPFRHATWQKLNGSKPSVQASWYADVSRQQSVLSTHSLCEGDCLVLADWVTWLQRQLADVHKNLKSPVTGIEKMG